MKKLSLGVLCALGILASGCDLDIPNDQLGKLSNAELCAFSGGEFNTNEKSCYCGGKRCGENVSCTVDTTTNQYVCQSAGNMDYPQYNCSFKGMTLCFDRIVEDKKAESGYTTSGYYILCDGTSWTTPTQCNNGASCSAYLEHDVFYSTQCGECNNADEGCNRGTTEGAH